MTQKQAKKENQISLKKTILEIQKLADLSNVAMSTNVGLTTRQYSAIKHDKKLFFKPIHLENLRNNIKVSNKIVDEVLDRYCKSIEVC